MPSFRNRPSRAASVFAVVVGLGMLIAFLTSFPMSGAPGLVFLFPVVLIGIIGYHVYNAATGKGYTEVYDIDREDTRATRPPRSMAPKASRKPTVRERLEKLDSLKADGLVSEEEYARKRSDILGDL